MGCKGSKEKSKTNETPRKREQYVEKIICKEADLAENEMKVFNLEEDESVLLVKQNGKISALGTRCTHYGAPLDKAALGEGRIRCQWHGACFNILNGDIEDFPGMDSLPCYQVKIEKQNVKIRAKKSELEANRRIKQPPHISTADNAIIVIIGGGPSGATCAETLRGEGFAGRIVLVGNEKYLPYDRVKVSKAMSSEIQDILLRNEDFYKDYNIEVITKTEVVCVDTKENVVRTSSGKSIVYDKLYIATGVSARKLKIPGSELNNIFVLKNYDDTQALLEQLTPEKHVVCIGASFIGMEAANSVLKKAAKVTVTSHRKVPFERSFGPRIGEAVLKLYQEKGIHFVLEKHPKKIIGNENGEVTAIEFDDGTILQADICILGIGSIPTTGFLVESGIKLSSDYSIEVDEYLQTNIPNVYAGGDVAHAPVWSHNNIKATIGHYGLAQMHGRIAAMNMVGKQTALKAVPFFWTVLFGKPINYAGYGEFDDIIYEGNVEEFKFVAFYLKNDEVVAMTGCMMYPIVAQFAELLAQGRKLFRRDIENDPLGWTKTIAGSSTNDTKL